MRSWLAVAAGKLAMKLCRWAGRGGSTLPGRIGLIIDPGLVAQLNRQLAKGCVVISGTNGKTTTTMLLARILTAGGDRVVYNRSGANMMSGVASTLIEAADWRGRLTADWALFEVDEAAAQAMIIALLPRLFVVTNCFRDQLDRYGEVEHTAALLHKAAAAMPGSGVRLFNADDPLIAMVNQRGVTKFFGIDQNRLTAGISTASDARNCLHCGFKLVYREVYYAHLGKYACVNCGFTQPRPDYVVRNVTSAGLRGTAFELVAGRKLMTLAVGIPGLFNVYNAAAAAAAALELGVGERVVADTLATAPAAFGRMERLQVGDREVFMALIKNPTGANEVVSMLVEEGGPLPIMIAINDLLADGTDVSWLWDVGFEQLDEELVPWIIVSGTRATDMAIRLKYGGYPVEKITVEADLQVAVREALERVPDGETVYLLPTYTAMLAIRSALHRQGHVTPFWEGR